MPREAVRTAWRRLFEVRLLHHYWLDEGLTPFDALPEATRSQRLLAYDARRFLGVQPTGTTTTALARSRGVFRPTSLGFLVAVPQDATLNTDDVWEFAVTPAAGDYADYTALTLRPGPAAVLSNLTGTARDGHLYLSRPYPSRVAAGAMVEGLARSDDELVQLTTDPPDPGFHVLGQADDLPVYVHQGDRPATVEPGTRPGQIALVRIAARRPDDAAFSVVTGSGAPRTATPVFEVHLRNRWTYRRYRSLATGAVTAADRDPSPMTWHGNGGTGRKPATTAVRIEREAGEPRRVTRLLSEISV